ncbi:MAG TPA: Hpt domain-containing protein, partial [Candidatus Krumholzibacterium sp.]|nr:Hpt domain-containing protein [Candidatus Krumholzibacterium sp.]
MKTHDYISLYVSETNEIIQGLEEEIMRLETSGDRKASIDEMFRHAHNLKGMSGAMGFDLVVEASHALENILDGCRKGTIIIGRAEVDLLLRVADLTGALVNWTVEGTGSGRGKDLLAEILVLLSPMNKRLADVASRNEKSGTEGREAADRTEEPCQSDPGPAGDDADEGMSGLCDPESIIDPAGGPDMPSVSSEVEGTGLKLRSPMGRGISSTKVDLERLDCLMDLVGELIISRIRLSSLAKEIGSRQLSDELASSGRLISEIQKEVMEARLIPAGQIFHRFKRLARDTSRELEKEIDFRVEGADIGLDRTVLESMIDPLVHMIRNAIDHGVESPQERKAAGKSPKAEVVLSARRERNHVILEVRDDGRGIDLEKIKEARGD